ncbi:hypothetical protein E5E91_15975 (plasmid) [Deinococcus radiodurans R1 = ATCC 13939 = DSM 20539]|uniref:Uncharacterized protein n=1 Tax=Deinococcus radiodurans (strain ATCC 13939 / DSM 20539 / JCM 16871 / CCUG 27074 / LMG 4051 / NBRC 15346 / NCIMB 9279 / VKM B-1422 / R1) TaxID=243230 RepID=Q9RZN9_DEIRA|nr:hypothetical protein DR_B0084 [Deinococcus radiodurans R1 = ATCC 13939 = DSM 20539]ANC73273.1 hypothetical protein A2G07_15635 [Deinococcus radiodurans R1 = ATCC 13939 = DSM 20539]QEM73263.1 hypothetical protein DXG80_15830 [Deinococcus radiodurans]UDL02211.1 hypothetical protein E5E91_15975 [Deinococcus radiodurans R1 = ATCC 13939 = DSM 20539]
MRRLCQFSLRREIPVQMAAPHMTMKGKMNCLTSKLFAKAINSRPTKISRTTPVMIIATCAFRVGAIT